MVERERCKDEFWGLQCDRPLGHGSEHSAIRDRTRVSWLDVHPPRAADQPGATGNGPPGRAPP